MFQQSFGSTDVFSRHPLIVKDLDLGKITPFFRALFLLLILLVSGGNGRGVTSSYPYLIFSILGGAERFRRSRALRSSLIRVRICADRGCWKRTGAL